MHRMQRKGLVRRFSVYGETVLSTHDDSVVLMFMQRCKYIHTVLQVSKKCLLEYLMKFLEPFFKS